MHADSFQLVRECIGDRGFATVGHQDRRAVGGVHADGAHRLQGSERQLDGALARPLEAGDHVAAAGREEVPVGGPGVAGGGATGPAPEDCWPTMNFPLYSPTAPAADPRAKAMDHHHFHSGSAEVERRILTLSRVREALLSEVEERERAAAEVERVQQTERAQALRAEALLARRYLT